MVALYCGACLLAGASSHCGAGPVAWLPPAVVGEGERRMIRSEQGVTAAFERQGESWRLAAYGDTGAGREWRLGGPRFSLQTPDGRRTNLGDLGFASCTETTEGGRPCVVLEASLSTPPVVVRQAFSFCADERTLRVRSALRATGEPLVIQRVGLLELRVEGQALKLMGPGNVSSPVFGDRVFAGIEHPAALCQVDGDMLYLAQHSYTRVGADWVELPGAVFGSASEDDAARFGGEALRRAFLRYLDTVRVHPRDMHLHYNDWWTMPVPSTEAAVLENLAELRRGLYDRTGLFFDSYAMDMGWSDPHSVWQIDRRNYPQGFDRIRDTLAAMGSRPGLWVSPSSCYPPALDNAWLEENGYEVLSGAQGSRWACLALGGRYQAALKRAALQHARDAHLAHMKFDGLVWPCPATHHGHHPGTESFQPIAEGLMDVLDALRAQDPDIALEPTCLGYYPSPWWLMHTPFVIGPFGDDSPNGRCPCPEWIESMTTGRDCANLKGREVFLMPSAALECFDIIVQCPGDFENHAVMALGRGHWFLSTYINPRFMDAGEWRFFADLVRWARANREFLREPLPFGGDAAERRPYGYAYLGAERQLFFARNPWIESAAVTLPPPPGALAREVRLLYPRREVLCRTEAGAPLPAITLGPYELAVVEAVPTSKPPLPVSPPPATPAVWTPREPGGFERLTYASAPAPFGPDCSSPDGDVTEALVFHLAGKLRTEAAELCLLVEGSPDVARATCELTLDGAAVTPSSSRSAGSFTASGAPPPEHWVWFLAPVPAGDHEVSFRVMLPDLRTKCALFLRGLAPCPSAGASFGRGPQLPLYHPRQRPWSQTLTPSATPAEPIPTRQVERRITKIDGVYLDTLDWAEATAGWGEVHRNRSVMGTPMLMAGRTFARGIGTHANSRIVYRVPPGYRRFAATIGCDQEVSANSVVFVVQGDGRTLFRSPVLRCASDLLDVDVSIKGVKTLALILEDAGDGIAADHGNWADARLLR